MLIVPTNIHDGKPEYGQVLEQNPDHPLARGLEVNWHGGADPLVNLVYPGRMLSYNTANVPGTRVTSDGLGTAFVGAGTDESIDLGSQTWIDTGQPFTMAFRLVADDLGIAGIWSFKTNTVDWVAILYANASYEDMTFGSTGTNWARRRTGSGTVPTGQPTTIVVRYNGNGETTTGNFECDIDGTAITLTTGGSFGASTGGNLVGSSGGANHMDGVGLGLRLWPRYRFSDDDLAPLFDNFWSPLEVPMELPPYPLEYFVSEAAVPGGATGIEDIYYKTLLQGTGY